MSVGFYERMKGGVRHCLFLIFKPLPAAFLLALIWGAFEAFRSVPFYDFTRFPVFQDGIQAVAGQRYFLKDAWRWPLLDTRFLMAPNGASVGMTDSTPLILLVCKVFAGVLPAGFVPYRLWLGLCFVLQPIAGVLALRASGERRFLALLAGGAIALYMPVFLGRAIHLSLMGQFVLLLGFALYFQLLRGKNLRLLPLFLICVLLIHPLLFVFSFLITASASLTLVFRRDRRWMTVSIWCGVSAICGVLLTRLLGYSRYDMQGWGYGAFSMDMLSPFWPMSSGLFPWFPHLPYGLQSQSFEGYDYLGGGLILLMAYGIIFRARALFQSVQRHMGMAIFLIVMIVYAVSTVGWAGGMQLWHVPITLPLESLFHASGRCFWVVCYALLIGCIRVTRGSSRRIWPVLLVLCVVCQYLDAQPLRRQARALWAAQPGINSEVSVLKQAMASSREVALYPVLGCGLDLYGPQVEDIMTVFRLSAEQGLPINTFYLSRPVKGLNCETEVPTAIQAAGVLEVYVGQQKPPEERKCQRTGGLTICSK